MAGRSGPDRPKAGQAKAGRAKAGRAPAQPARGKAQPASVKAAGEGDELRKRSELLWDAQLRPSRGPKPATSREDVVQAAISLADGDGLSALTMHAVAARLGFTPMALYRYFPNKEALVDAAVDAAMGVPPPRSGPREGWRAEVKHWSYAKRAMLCARPWLAELPFVAAPHGPNWLSWHEAFLASIADAGLSPEDMMDMLSVVHGYVHGSSDTIISLARATARGITPEQWAEAVGADLCRAINDPRYPMLSAILTSSTGGITDASPLPVKRGRPRTMDESFDFGLERVLDGIELYLDSQRES